MPFEYHKATKHYFHRSARSPGFLDWANQPGPFRRYRGAPLHVLPFPQEDRSPPYEALYTPGAIAPRTVDLHSIGELFECALGLSAWKEYRGERWALRCNPSSGNLHPTEGYLIAGPVEGLNDAPTVYHYAPKEHGLEERAMFSLDVWQGLLQGFPVSTFFVGLTSIHWREAWKYGERAYRYCNLDTGHALAALSLSAAALGWRAVHLASLSDKNVARLLGIDRERDRDGGEAEHPELLLAIVPAIRLRRTDPAPRELPPTAIEAVAAAPWKGHANRLSRQHTDWEIIERTAAACEKPRTRENAAPPFQHPTSFSLQPSASPRAGSSSNAAARRPWTARPRSNPRCFTTCWDASFPTLT